MSRIVHALICIMILAGGLGIFAFAGYNMAAGISVPSPKSAKEICKEKGGVWVEPYRSEGTCYAKESIIK